MLTKFLRFAGLTPASQPPARPLSRRSDTPAGPRPTGPAPVSDAVRQQRAEAKADLHRRALATPQIWHGADRNFIRAYQDIDKASVPNGMSVNEAALSRARLEVGREVAEYLRAMQILGRRTRWVTEAQIQIPEKAKAIRRDLETTAATDFTTWDEARQVLSRRQTDARRLGEPVPPDLYVSPAVEQGIAEMLAERVARLAKRASQSGRGNTGTGGTTGDAGTGVIPPGTTPPKGTADEEPEIHTPPGPKKP
ncbi:hypothetical protein [Methylobacterium sp. Leaf85]|uniref:hypothetical protein n=1 Tax=Methylobacterium sp. Leaf85 TaxID=1736241 RepID=UPI0012E853B0|nr:hypothetical protein [Methylobacterium sp. Leaf85]